MSIIARIANAVAVVGMWYSCSLISAWCSWDWSDMALEIGWWFRRLGRAPAFWDSSSFRTFVKKKIKRHYNSSQSVSNIYRLSSGDANIKHSQVHILWWLLLCFLIASLVLELFPQMLQECGTVVMCFASMWVIMFVLSPSFPHTLQIIPLTTLFPIGSIFSP